MKAISVAAVLVLTSGSAHAANYAATYVDDRQIFLVELEGRKKTGSVIRAWELRIFKEPRPTSSGSGTYSRLFNLSEFNCADRTSRVETVATYTADGRLLGSSNPGWSQWQSVIPSTVGEAVLKSVCDESYFWQTIRWAEPDEAEQFYRGYLIVEGLKDK